MLTKGRKVNTLYVLEDKIKKECVKVAVKDSIETWHDRLGYISEKRLEIIAIKWFYLALQVCPSRLVFIT